MDVCDKSELSNPTPELQNAASVLTALALASKTGLLKAMLIDETPRSSHEWGTRCFIHFKTSHDILQMLHTGQVTLLLHFMRFCIVLATKSFWINSLHVTVSFK